MYSHIPKKAELRSLNTKIETVAQKRTSRFGRTLWRCSGWNSVSKKFGKPCWERWPTRMTLNPRSTLFWHDVISMLHLNCYQVSIPKDSTINEFGQSTHANEEQYHSTIGRMLTEKQFLSHIPTDTLRNLHPVHSTRHQHMCGSE